MLLAFLWACSPPVQAPKELDSLNSYLYAHFEDEVAYLEAGSENLALWLESNLLGIQEGYTVKQLTEEAIRTVNPDYVREVDLVGVALSRDIDSGVDVLAHYTYWNNPEDPRDDTTWLGDEACFLAMQCETYGFERSEVADFPLGIEVDVTYRSEARWVPTMYGMGLVQRRYHTVPAEVNVSWADLIDEFSVESAIPLADGGFRRTSSSWVAVRLGDIPVPHSILLSLGMGEMENYLNGLQGNLDGHAEKMAGLEESESE